MSRHVLLKRHAASRWAASAAILAAAIAAPAGSAAADTARPLSIELNKLEPAGDACRVMLVIDNRREPFAGVKLDLVVFDTDGIVAKRLAVDLGALAAPKTVVKVFDLAALPCPQVGRLLLNAAPECRAGEAAPADCTSAIEVSSRASAPFVK